MKTAKSNNRAQSIIKANTLTTYRISAQSLDDITVDEFRNLTHEQLAGILSITPSQLTWLNEQANYSLDDDIINVIYGMDIDLVYYHDEEFDKLVEASNCDWEVGIASDVQQGVFKTIHGSIEDALVEFRRILIEDLSGGKRERELGYCPTDDEQSSDGYYAYIVCKSVDLDDPQYYAHESERFYDIL